ncbi:MAG: succinate--CoA ligase subunit alpha, partial [Acidobacteria bacterium]|nr:succinate--CoA ligase subunit alpha [Acidobacteriota bacterium]
MSIFIGAESKVIVQGMTGSEGTKHTKRMLKSGTKVVGGVTPGKGGQVVDIDGTHLPVFNTVQEAMAAT